MRRILREGARRATSKPGCGWERVTLDGIAEPDIRGARELIALDEALTRLGDADPRNAQVELRYFGGLSVEETAAVLKVSPDCRWRRKRGPVWRVKGASSVVTLWTLPARSRAELDDSSCGRDRVVALRQLELPCGNCTASTSCDGSRHLDRDHQVMISEMPVGVKENLLESRDYFCCSQFWLSSA